jgi:hypothetical protein
MMNNLKTKTKVLLLSSIALGTIISCTDLEVEETDSILATEFQGITDPAEASSQVTAMYNNVRGWVGDQAGLFALSEVTTDSQLIPTRGSDWGDNGIWRQLHQHSWTPDHAFITNVWNNWNELQLTASELLDSRSTPSATDAAQASFLRGLAMYVILDNFGQIPYRNTTAPSIEDPSVLTGSEAVDFIVSDLQNAINGLPDSSPTSDNVRATKPAARYLLAKVLLNKHIFTGSGSPDAADMASVISLVDEITGDGFALDEGYFDIFRNTADTETIWYVNTGVGNRIYNGLHYLSTSVGGGGWNGFSTLAEYYDLFEGDPNSNNVDLDGNPLDGQEERRGGVPPAGNPFTGVDGTAEIIIKDDSFEAGSNVGYGFLIGQQFSLNGDPLQDRGGAPLSFTREFTSTVSGTSSLIDNNEVTGIRLMKYSPRYNDGFTEHEIFFRYSDAYLMKAEAMFRSGGDPTAMINDLRTIRNTQELLGSVSEQDILDERARELFVEFWRRNDLIRFGQYTRDWEFKDPAAIGNSDKTLFPIPATQIILNPNLIQNPGY